MIFTPWNVGAPVQHKKTSVTYILTGTRGDGSIQISVPAPEWVSGDGFEESVLPITPSFRLGDQVIYEPMGFIGIVNGWRILPDGAEQVFTSHPHIKAGDSGWCPATGFRRYP